MRFGLRRFNVHLFNQAWDWLQSLRQSAARLWDRLQDVVGSTSVLYDRYIQTSFSEACLCDRTQSLKGSRCYIWDDIPYGLMRTS